MDSHPRRILILGTGTAVGKTEVGAALLATATRNGLRALGLKPVESGVGEDGECDAERLGQSAGIVVPPLHALPAPLSPHLAARLCGAEIRPALIVEWVDAMTASHEPNFLLVETAGGLCTPLTQTIWNLHLATSLPHHVSVLVAPNRLGVIHEVLSCVSLMRHSGLRPPRIVLTGAGSADASTPTNVEEVATITGLVTCHFERGEPLAAPLAALASSDPCNT